MDTITTDPNTTLNSTDLDKAGKLMPEQAQINKRRPRLINVRTMMKMYKQAKQIKHGFD